MEFIPEKARAGRQVAMRGKDATLAGRKGACRAKEDGEELTRVIANGMGEVGECYAGAVCPGHISIVHLRKNKSIISQRVWCFLLQC